MNNQNGDFDNWLKIIWLILTGVIIFLAGRFTGNIEIKVIKKAIREETYKPSACLQAVCRSLFPCFNINEK